MRRSEGHRLPDGSEGAHADAILPLVALRDRAVTDLVLCGLDASGVAFALFSPEDGLSYGSRAFRALFAVQPGARSFADILRHCHTANTGPKIDGPIDDFLAMARRKRRSGPQRTFEIDIVDGRWFLVHETVLADGWMWSVFTDITMLKSNERVLQLAADTDPLTGLLNRRAAMERLDAEMRIALGNRSRLSLALIDLDHFKTINDRYGHARGDDVLRHFSAAGRQHLRAGDTFARIGGEEFLMIMPGAGLCEATEAVERLRRHVAQAENRAGLCCTYSMSAGVAEHRGKATEDLFERADRALYRAKHLGRDRIAQAD